MTEITWDEVSQRTFQTGIDRGVVYLSDSVVPWNGLTSIEEDDTRETKEFFLDSQKYLDVQILGNYTAEVKALGYPDELSSLMGISEYIVAGLFIADQPTRLFNFSYRTLIGNVSDGIDYGYKIHVVYSARLNPKGSEYETVGDETNPIEFSWGITSVPSAPAVAPGIRPTAHLIFDSTKMAPEILELLEGLLYGTISADPELPSMAELLDILEWGP